MHYITYISTQNFNDVNFLHLNLLHLTKPTLSV